MASAGHVSVTVLHSFDDLKALYAGVTKAFRDINYRAYLQAELTHLETQHAGYFSANKGPDGAQWPPLARSTVAAKHHGTILVDSTALKDSLTSGSGAAIREAIDEGASKGLSFGTDVRNDQGEHYSIFHDRPYKNRPARRHVGTNDNHLTKMTERAADYTLAALKKS